ncbi:LysM peptidoglycan-binding domain-containing protein [Paraburkholderia bannensis]|uniref:LysM peptidoglycan-binding domain-containing protein n=1 Tax=Paraburkholderia bannensis TaxID=765414 RepID=UPI002AB7CB9D|nr:LysM peptidoglycan-binding domain-containing protein [Paraburkholderia bannensis]
MAQKFVSATFHLEIHTAEFVAENGDHFLRSGGNPAWRFNNPGNMRPPSKRVITTHIGRAKMRDGKYFLIFPDYATGRAELKRLLRDPDSYAQRTLKQAIPKFAPKTDNNDPDKYIRVVTQRTGLSDDTKLGTLTDAQLEQLMDSIETFEGYHGNKATQSEKWVKATNIALSDGARPIANQPVIVRQNGRETRLTSGPTGTLPAIPHVGGRIDVLMADTRDGWNKVTSIGLQDASKTFLLVRNLFVAKTSTAPHVPRGDVTPAKRVPFAYRIEPHDTLSKIAARFKTSVAKLKEDNKLHSDLIVVGRKLMIYGGGVPSPHHAAPQHHASSAAAPAASAATHASAPVNKPPAAAASAPSVASAPAPQKAPQVAQQMPVSSTTSSATQAAPHAEAQSGAITQTRSQDGVGRPLALVPPDQRRAPWMSIAIAEGERWGGADESLITKTMNYHALVDNRNWLKDLNGTKHAWCSAFVNWVMMKDGRHMVTKGDDRHRARGFVGDPNFPQIKKPVFGCIAVLGNLGHVVFVYGHDPKSKMLVVLGGNQGGDNTFGGTIDFSSFHESAMHGFYVPVTYLPYAQAELAKGVQLPEANAADLNKLHHIKDPHGNGTR